MEIPESIVVQYFYQYSGYPEYNRSNKTYNACCPICKEGKSWGKKKRLYYISEQKLLHCHNCQKTWNPIQWIEEVSGKTYYEILLELDDENELLLTEKSPEKKKNKNTLPYNSINLYNENEIYFYKNNKTVIDALNFIKNRRLNTAINKTELFLSLKDFTYKNRICIPFKDLNDKIIFYQCRALYKKDEEMGRKYISKINEDKSVFNISKIDLNFPYIFLFEGPIDSMFVKNGVGVAGLSLTQTQNSQLNRFLLHEKIWVLDNQRIDDSSAKKTLDLVKRGENVFIWPKNFSKYKDINDLCVDLKKDEINPDFFIKNSVKNEIDYSVKMCL
jgi:hypothetical protein